VFIVIVIDNMILILINSIKLKVLPLQHNEMIIIMIKI